MAILGIWSLAEEFGFPSARNSTTAGTFDTDWCNSSIVCGDNIQGPILNVPFSHPGTDIWFHFEMYAASGATHSNVDGTWWILHTQAGTGNWYVKANLTNGQVEYKESDRIFFSGGSSLAVIPMPSHLSRVTYDIHCRVNNAGNDEVRIYHNGALYGILNSPTKISRFNSLDLRNSDNEVNYYYSQLLVADEPTIGMKFSRMRPNAAGAHSQFNGDFNSVISPFDGQAISANTIGHRESWNLENYSGPVSPAGIRSVLQASYASLGTSAVPGGYEHFLRIGTTDYDGTKIIPAPGEQGITEWATNPDTGQPWNTAELDSLIAGVEAVA